MKRIVDIRKRCRSTALPEPGARRGTAILIAMVVLLILMMISATLISSVIRTRTQFVREEQGLQAALLAEAGIGRGLAQLRIDRSFTGEVWQIPADQLTGVGPASIAITIKDAVDQPGERIVVAAAEYPQGTPQPIRITRELRIPKKGSEKGV